MIVMKLSDRELAALKASKSQKEWNDLVEWIKSARDGKMPDDWHRTVLSTGLIHEVMKGWQK